MTDLIEIGEILRKARKEKGFSQTDLARKAATSRPTIAAIENGRAPEVGFKLLLRILNAVDVDLRISSLNAGRPTLEDLTREEEAGAPRLGR